MQLFWILGHFFSSHCLYNVCQNRGFSGGFKEKNDIDNQGALFYYSKMKTNHVSIYYAQ